MTLARTAILALLLAFAVPAGASADRLVVPGGPAFKTVQTNVPALPGKEIASFNGFLYFAANDNAGAGIELWRTDGTGAGTTQVMDINPGPGNSNPNNFFVAGNRLYFNADPGNSQSVTIFYIDTAAPTTVVTPQAQPHGGGSPVAAFGFLMGAVNDKVVAARYSNAAGECSCYAVYAQDASSTTPFAKISVGAEDAAVNQLFSPSATVGGWIYYTRSNVNVAPGQGGEPWRTNGTTTQVVKDLNAGSGGNTGSSPSAWFATSDRVYFVANDGLNGNELWTSNPLDVNDTHIIDKHHSAATMMKPDGTSINDPGQVANGNILYYVPANDPVTGPEVWRTDGTEAGTRVVKDITPGVGGFSQPILFPFKTGVGILRGDIFYGDGSPDNAALLNSADGDGYGPNNPVVLGDKAYFVGGASPFGQAIWRTDGSADGTFPLSAGGFDGTGAAGGCPCAQMLGGLGGKLLFVGRDQSTNDSGYVKVFAIDQAQPDELRAATGAPVATLSADGSYADVTKGTWSGRPTVYTYQWLRNGQPIDKATNPRYFLVAADGGQTITARVTTAGIGAPRFASAESGPVTKAATPSPTAGPTLTPIPTPSSTPTKTLTVKTKAKLKGKPKVGVKLKLKLPSLTQSGIKLSFRWYANGKRIKKQGKSSLKLSKKLKGKKISAKITVTKPGYKTLTIKVGPTKKVKGR